jgi:hypothetical protein
MRTNCKASLLTLLAIASAGACTFPSDSVAPGYYGAPEAGSRAVSNAVTSQPASAGQLSAAPPAAAAATTPGTGGASGTAPNAAPAASTEPMAGSAAGTGATSARSGANCDLSGRWLSVLHLVTDALGQLQVAHDYIYYEIEQKGAAFTIRKGILCGVDAIGQGALAVTVDFHATWPSVMSKVNYKGRAGSSAPTSGGCNVAFNKWYTTRGATLPYYLEPSTTLPTAAQQATGSTPGWEDWDGDGNPGITGVISGVVNGKIFVAPRLWESVSATVPDVSTAFKVPVQWDQEQNVMAYDGSPLLASSAARSSNASLQFAQFARLTKAQATGDDATLCKSIVALAPMLTPEAAGE